MPRPHQVPQPVEHELGVTAAYPLVDVTEETGPPRLEEIQDGGVLGELGRLVRPTPEDAEGFPGKQRQLAIARS
jgi:hypothetical protein